MKYFFKLPICFLVVLVLFTSCNRKQQLIDDWYAQSSEMKSDITPAVELLKQIIVQCNKNDTPCKVIAADDVPFVDYLTFLLKCPDYEDFKSSHVDHDKVCFFHSAAKQDECTSDRSVVEDLLERLSEVGSSISKEESLKELRFSIYVQTGELDEIVNHLEKYQYAAFIKDEFYADPILDFSHKEYTGGLLQSKVEIYNLSTCELVLDTTLYVCNDSSIDVHSTSSITPEETMRSLRGQLYSRMDSKVSDVLLNIDQNLK